MDSDVECDSVVDHRVALSDESDAGDDRADVGSVTGFMARSVTETPTIAGAIGQSMSDGRYEQAGQSSLAGAIGRSEPFVCKIGQGIGVAERVVSSANLVSAGVPVTMATPSGMPARRLDKPPSKLSEFLRFPSRQFKPPPPD